jgi:hypothetical protein
MDSMAEGCLRRNALPCQVVLFHSGLTASREWTFFPGSRLKGSLHFVK